MPFDSTTRTTLFRVNAADYLNVAIRNIEREYPYMPWMFVDGPGPLPTHRELHPTFFGSFDWHSCRDVLGGDSSSPAISGGRTANGVPKIDIVAADTREHCH